MTRLGGPGARRGLPLARVWVDIVTDKQFVAFCFKYSNKILVQVCQTSTPRWRGTACHASLIILVVALLFALLEVLDQLLALFLKLDTVGAPICGLGRPVQNGLKEKEKRLEKKT